MIDNYSCWDLLRLSDFIWGGAAFFLLYIIVFVKRKKYKDTPIYKYYTIAFFLHLLFALIYAGVSQYYFVFADTNHYYRAVLDMHAAVLDKVDHLKDIYNDLKLTDDNPVFPYFYYDEISVTHFYMADVKNYFVPKVALPFSLMFNGSYVAIVFCLSFFSFAGCWRMFKMFYQLYPHLHKKIAIAFLFMPSILFWGVGLLKDTICIGAMGLSVYASYCFFIKGERKAIHLIILIANAYLIFYIKPYILICLAPAFLMWIFLRARNMIADKTLRQIATFLFAVISLGAAFLVVQSFTSSELASQYSTENILKTVNGQRSVFESNQAGGGGGGSNFSSGAAATSFGSLAIMFPSGIVNTFFRPWPWDVNSPFMTLSFFESFGFLFLTYLSFKRIGIKEFFKILFSDPTIIFCFVFAIFFGGLIGMTTINFGALNRYKIPCIPFFAMMLFLVMDKSGKFSPNIVFSKKLF